MYLLAEVPGIACEIKKKHFLAMGFLNFFQMSIFLKIPRATPGISASYINITRGEKIRLKNEFLTSFR